MKKIKCPNCNKEINIEDLASANIDIIQDFKNKAQQEHDLEIETKIKKEIQKAEKESREVFEIRSRETEKELIVLQEKLKAQEKIKQQQEQLQKEKIKQEVNRAEQVLKQEHELKERELIHLQEQLKAQEKIKQQQEQLQKEKNEQEIRKTKQELETHYQKKEMIKEKEILQQKRDMENLREKFEKIQQERESQELIGEYGEEFIKNMIIQALPQDEVVDIKKGALGADLAIKVKDNNGRECGSILVEVKNTKQWESKWISKFQNDLMNSGCDVGLLVSKSQPKKNKGEHSFEMYNDNLLSCSFKDVVPIITLLRQRVFEIYKLSKKQENLVNEKDILFSKINSPEFKQRIQVIIDRFGAMKDEYEKQQRDMHRSFERQKQHLGILVQQVIALDETVNTSLLSNPKDSNKD